MITEGVPAALAPTGMSVSCPKERLDGHALPTQYPLGEERRAEQRYQGGIQRSEDLAEQVPGSHRSVLTGRG